MDVFRYIQTACTLYRFILKAFSICIEICVIIIVLPSGCAYKMVCTFTVIPQKFPVHCLSAFTLWTLKQFASQSWKSPVYCLLSTHSVAMSLTLVLWDSKLRDCHHIITFVSLEGLVLVCLIFWPHTQASFSQFCVPPLLQQKCIPIWNPHESILHNWHICLLAHLLHGCMWSRNVLVACY